jgi:hypothetical protein
MLVEVEAGLTSQAVVAQAVDLCLSGPDDGGSGQSSARLLEPEQVGGSPPTDQVDLPSGLLADVGCPIEGDATTTLHSDVVMLERQGPSDGPSATVDTSAVGMTAAASAAMVQEELEALVCLPLQTPLLQKPRLRCSRTAVSIHSLRRSSHIAARPRAANAIRQAQNVLLRKLSIEVEEDVVDSEVESKFKAVFHHMSANKQQQLEILLNCKLDLAAMDLDLTGLDADEV